MATVACLCGDAPLALDDNQGEVMTVLATTMATPVGDLALLVCDDVLVAAGFTDVHDQHARLHTEAPLKIVTDLGRFSAAMAAYFDGDVTAMDTLPVAQP